MHVFHDLTTVQIMPHDNTKQGLFEIGEQGMWCR